MKKWFPEMYDRPENGPVAASAIYWPICYFMIPLVTLLFAWIFSSSITAVTAVDLITYLLNFLFYIGLFRTYLADSFLNVQTDVSGFLKTLIPVTVLILAAELGLMYEGVRRGWTGTFCAYPISETSMVASTSFLVIANPIFGTLCMTVLTPVTVSCMFYGTVFAPIANSRPVLAYFATAGLMVLPRLLSAWWMDNSTYDWAVYLLQLPVHMLACWSYQKTNTIWAPIFSLAISNFLVCMLLCYLAAIGFLYV